jgi:hypothetical protein
VLRSMRRSVRYRFGRYGVFGDRFSGLARELMRLILVLTFAASGFRIVAAGGFELAEKYMKIVSL